MAETLRSVAIERTGAQQYLVRNPRGGSLTIGSGGDADFTPVELLLAAIGGCSAIDVDMLTSRRAEPTQFAVTVTGHKIRDAAGDNHLEDISAVFSVAFPEGEQGDAAREQLPRAVQLSHDRLCTVSRTVERPSPVTTTLADPDR
ncbi:MAG: OsmC family protein [Micromonosporaceae bacterium]